MSYIDLVPIEKDASYEQNWLSYLSCVVAICAADELSDAERAAILAWMRGHGLPPDLLDKAINHAKTLDIASLKSNPAAQFFAPYIVRDAIRMSGIDGQSKKELAHIAEVAKALGLSEMQIAGLSAVVAGHNATLALWQSLLPR